MFQACGALWQRFGQRLWQKMIKQHYTGNSRRAMNLIWNAAQDYDWQSPFLAFYSNGDPDDYLNTVIGLSAKWLDRERITDFFERLGEGPTLDEASSLLWLGIENCVYEKELPLRPHLSGMRRERAEEFFRIQGMLSEQQMAFMSIRVYDQELLRWSHVLGRKVLSVGPGAVKLSKMLEFSGQWDTEEVLAQMHLILKTVFRRTLPDHPQDRTGRKKNLLEKLTGSLAGGAQRSSDLLVLRRGSGSGDHKRSVHITHGFEAPPASGQWETERSWLEETFGPCMFTDAEMKILESSICVGNDASCRLWITNRGQTEAPSSKDAGKLRQDQEAQRRRNEEYYRKNLFRIRESIRNLSAQTDTIFQSYLRCLPAAARQGRLDGSIAWRVRVLGDNRIFLTDSDPEEASVCVDLLLDASQSRMNSQEMIASQALVISRSFEECHIPVRVTAFRSLRGTTILQRLKDFGDRNGNGIFRYYAGGWNRDALCLKTMEYLMEEERKQGDPRTRILMVLTDASPNDSTPIPPGRGSRFSHAYEGDMPVRDAHEAVRKLTAAGIRTSALFYGSTAHLEQVHQIYGQQYVRVKTLSQLPDAVCEILRRSLARAQAQG